MTLQKENESKSFRQRVELNVAGFKVVVGMNTPDALDAAREAWAANAEIRAAYAGEEGIFLLASLSRQSGFEEGVEAQRQMTLKLLGDRADALERKMEIAAAYRRPIKEVTTVIERDGAGGIKTVVHR